jgi:transposase-like protein
VVDPSLPSALDAPAYLDFLDREYLTPYVARGGAAVKLLVTGDEAAAEKLAAGLAGLGDGFQHAGVDAVTTRIHLIDQVFAEVARQLDWLVLAGSVVHAAYTAAGFPPPSAAPSASPSAASPSSSASTSPLAVSAVARHHDVDPAELYRSVRRALELMVLRDAGLGHEFRTAMFRLCQNRLGRGEVSRAECETVVGWLRAERVPAAELRKLSLTAKVGRHNPRSMLLSLTRWLRLAGHGGLVLRLDLSRVAVSRRPPAGMRDGHYYSKAAALDAYELVRQLIDGTDEFEGLLVAVLLPQELVNDEIRGLPAYSALRLRVVDEVRDRQRANPYATLIRIGSESEVSA